MSLPWFGSWLRSHLKRHFSLGLPCEIENPEYYDGWELNFECFKVTEEQAQRASIRIMGRAKPVRYHYEQLCKAIIDAKPKKEVKEAKPTETYTRPSAPRGAELQECLENARDGSPVARAMRLELQRYILAGEIDPRRIPPDLYDLIAAEQLKEEPITPPRLRSAADVRGQQN